MVVKRELLTEKSFTRVIVSHHTFGEDLEFIITKELKQVIKVSSNGYKVIVIKEGNKIKALSLDLVSFIDANINENSDTLLCFPDERRYHDRPK